MSRIDKSAIDAQLIDEGVDKLSEVSCCTCAKFLGWSLVAVIQAVFCSMECFSYYSSVKQKIVVDIIQ